MGRWTKWEMEVRWVCDGKWGGSASRSKCFGPKVGRQLVWTLRVAGNARQGNALEAATNCHLFLRRLQLRIQQQIEDQRVLALFRRKTALPRCTIPCKALLDLLHFPWRETLVLRLRAMSESLDQLLKIRNCFSPEST